MIQNWHRDEGPCIGLGVEGVFDDIHLWENDRLVYPTVVSIDGEYWMWYGSYSQYGGEEMKTATGCAYNTDGLSWQKDPDNPVFGPDPSRPGNRTTRPANRYCASQMVPSASGTLRARHPLSSTSILP